MIDHRKQRLVLDVRWGKSLGSKDTECSAELDLTEATRFEIPDAGRVSITARLVEPAKSDEEKRRLAHLDLLAKARRGEVPTVPLAWSSDVVLLDEGTREIRVEGGKVGPGESVALGGCANFNCLPVGLDMFDAPDFEVDQVVAARHSLLGSGSLPARYFTGDWKERAPFGGVVVGCGVYFRVMVRNVGPRPAAVRGVLHVVDLLEHGL